MEIINTLGRRKTAIARIYLQAGNGSITVNGRDYAEYFPSVFLQNNVLMPLEVTGTTGQFDIKCNVVGGGMTGQSGAIRLAIARALDKVDAETHHTALKSEGLFTRDARMVERKKYGRKKARKRFQFSKR